LGDEFGESLAKRFEPCRSREGLVQPKHRDQDRRPVVGQSVTVLIEIRASRSKVDLVGRPAKVSEDKTLVRKTALNRRFEKIVVLHPLGQGVADDHDLVAFVDRQPIGPFASRTAHGCKNRQESNRCGNPPTRSAPRSDPKTTRNWQKTHPNHPTASNGLVTQKTFKNRNRCPVGSVAKPIDADPFDQGQATQ
jgi:hypothetical protein